MRVLSPATTLSLEEAQEAKKRHIAAKLDLQPGQRVLDIGCGFGGMALFLARNYGVHVTGMTLSTEQLKIARERAAKQGLTRLVEFRLEDYRRTRGPFDRIVSVGMFEHVGRPHYGQFFSRINGLLADDGVALLHTIGRQLPPSPINAWMRQNIFPGAYLPSLSQLAPVLEKQDYWLADFENLRLHYATTLREWNRRFQLNRERVRAARSCALRRPLLPHVGVLSAGLRGRLPPQRPDGVPAAADQEGSTRCRSRATTCSRRSAGWRDRARALPGKAAHGRRVGPRPIRAAKRNLRAVCITGTSRLAARAVPCPAGGIG